MASRADLSLLGLGPPLHDRGVPTVAVVHPEGEARGPLVMNASEYDPALHVRWEDRAAASAASDSEKLALTPAIAPVADRPAPERTNGKRHDGDERKPSTPDAVVNRTGHGRTRCGTR